MLAVLTVSGNISMLQPLDWRLAYSPSSPVLDELVSRVSRALLLEQHVATESAAELETRLIRGHLLCGIEFDASLVCCLEHGAHNNLYIHGMHYYAPIILSQNYDTLPKHLSYALRFPGELRTARSNPLIFNWQTDKSVPVARVRGPRSRNHSDGGVPPGYGREGFLAVQHALADQFLRLQSAEAARMPSTFQIQRFPFPPFRSDHLLEHLESLVALIVLLSFIYPCINTVRAIATEKERQLKEAMQIMGMPAWLHWVGWFVRSMVYMMVSISLMVMMLKVRWTAQPVAVLTETDWTVLWLYLWVYSVSTVMFCFMMSVFFAKANVAAAVAGLVWFLLYLVYVFLQPDSMEWWQLMLLSAFFSNTGMSLGFMVMLR